MDPTRLAVTLAGVALIVAVNLYFFAWRGRSRTRGGHGRPATSPRDHGR